MMVWHEQSGKRRQQQQQQRARTIHSLKTRARREPGRRLRTHKKKKGEPTNHRPDSQWHLVAISHRYIDERTETRYLPYTDKNSTQARPQIAHPPGRNSDEGAYRHTSHRPMVVSTRQLHVPTGTVSATTTT
ncbi:unnamed protein product, partial [Ectocarpus sp. 8 AP-2014]